VPVISTRGARPGFSKPDGAQLDGAFPLACDPPAMGRKAREEDDMGQKHHKPDEIVGKVRLAHDLSPGLLSLF
jgi:hypothetical protein